ncbi:MAG: Re/Si-specific NAD(P)(+) transhydrogenase subunit alpha [Planctomycetota bacterium]
MKLVIPKEIMEHERRVAATPDTVGKMVKKGIEVLVEAGAGLESSISDADYTAAGAKIVPTAEVLYGQADVVFKVQRPLQNAKLGRHEADLMKPGATLVSFLFPVQNADVVSRLAQKKVAAFAVDCIPRISRAQSMDGLSSMSNLAGYKAVLLAANALGKIFPMMTTAAGTIYPSKVIIIGAGVAGLQACAQAKRMGAVVTVFDVRPVVAEQVKSLGCEFVPMDVPHDAQDAGGYAKELGADFYKKEQEIVAKYSKDADVIITTALIPGKRAPILITEEMVKQMKMGSVIVDLSVEQKGNCILSEPGQTVVKHGVTIIGILNLPSMIPACASQLYARNLLTFLNLAAPDGKEMKFDMNDEVIKGALITRNGEVLHPGVKEALKKGGVA